MYRKCTILAQLDSICGFRHLGLGGRLRLYPLQVTLSWLIQLCINTTDLSRLLQPQRPGGHARCWPSQVTSQSWSLAAVDPGPAAYTGLFLSRAFSNHPFPHQALSGPEFICLCAVQCGFIILHESRPQGRKAPLGFPSHSILPSNISVIPFFPNEPATRRTAQESSISTVFNY